MKYSPLTIKVFVLMFAFFLMVGLTNGAINDNMLMHYALNETSGNAEDSANILNATQSGTVATAYYGILNNSRTGFSSANYFSGTLPFVLSSNYSVTVNSWWYPTGTCTDDYGGFVVGTTTTNDEFHVYCDTGRAWVIAFAKSVDSGLTLPLNTWTMVTMTYNGSTNKVVSVFVNGSFVKNSSSSTQNGFTSTSLLIGKVSNGYPYDHGSLDEITLWNRTLSNSEIAGLYANYTSGHGYPFNWTAPQIPPNRTELIRPCNLSYTANSSGIPVFFNWSNSSDTNGDTFNFSILINSSILATVLNNNLSYTHYFNNSYSGDYNFSLLVNDNDGNTSSVNSCLVSFCVNDWVANWSECSNGNQIKNYYDTNSCSNAYDYPSDYLEERTCYSATFLQFDLDEHFYVNLFFWVIMLLLFRYAYRSRVKYFKISYALIGLLLFYYSEYVQNTIFLTATEGALLLASEVMKYCFWLASLYFLFIGVYSLFRS